MAMKTLLWYCFSCFCIWSVNAQKCTPNPCNHGGVCTLNSKSPTGYTCECASGYQGPTCKDDIDMCRSNPCQNHGSCKNGVNNYTCNCAEGFSGKNCQTDDDTCRSGPCLNGANCTNGVNSYTCQCKDGFQGQNCEVDDDKCRSNPCLHGGICQNVPNAYKCVCPKGYTGNDCSIDNNLCRSTPCQHGGTCHDGPNTYTCSCLDGFNGTNCQTDNEMCKSKPCKNNATCEDKPNGYICHCQKNFTGFNCSIDEDACRTYPCKQGGKCTNIPSKGSFTCDCPMWAFGKTCEGSVCASGSVETNCEITNITVFSKLFYNTSIPRSENSPATTLYKYVGNHSVTFNGMSYDFGFSKVFIHVHGSIILRSSSILMSTTFKFNASSIHVLDASSLHTTGMGLLSKKQDLVGTWGKPQDGASHVGVGGASESTKCFFLQSMPAWKLPENMRYLTLPSANECGRGVKNVRGGGTIELRAARTITLHGSLLADGGRAGEGGGGAGGSINIIAKSLTTGPHSVISVAGGAGVFAGSTAADEENLASGGGGVLKVTTDTAKDVSNFYISGGNLQNKDGQAPKKGCLYGGSGVYLSCWMYGSCSLFISGGNISTNAGQVGVTPLEVTREMRILHLSIEGPASLLTSEVTLDLPSGVGWQLNPSMLVSEQSLLLGYQPPGTTHIDITKPMLKINATSDGDVYILGGKISTTGQQGLQLVLKSRNFSITGASSVTAEIMTADVLYFHISDGSQLVIGQMGKISCMSALIQGSISMEPYFQQLARLSRTSRVTYADDELPEWAAYTKNCENMIECTWDIDAQVIFIKAVDKVVVKNAANLHAGTIFLEAGNEVDVAYLTSGMSSGSLCAHDIMDLQDCSADSTSLIRDQNYGIIIRVLNLDSNLYLRETITSPSVLLCSAGNLISSPHAKVMTTNMCCQSNDGSGPGSSGTNCGGAGHGGRGASGWDPGSKGGNGGQRYDIGKTPKQCGSGGGAGSTQMAGYGGGVINVNVGDTFHHDGTLAASGGSVHSRSYGESGGGSGGSIIVNLYTFSGVGKVLAQGGDAFPETGAGGGGGGRILMVWKDTKYGNYSGVLSVSGGKSGIISGIPLPRGSEGMANALECDLGHGGALCHACSPGFFSSNKTSYPCRSCPVGKYSANPGATKCEFCRAGQFNNLRNQSRCTACPLETYSENRGSTACNACKFKPDNSFYSETGQTNVRCAFNCSEGRAGLDCHKCMAPPRRFGQKSLVCNGEGTCYGNKKNPNITCGSHGVKCGTCNCKSGFVPPYCMTQVQMIENKLGPVGFSAAVILSVGTLIFLLWAFKCQCKKKKQSKDKGQHGRSGSDASDSFSLISDKQQQSYSTMCTNNQSNPANSFEAQVCRLYFSGSNQPGDPLHLFPSAPQSLDATLSEPAQYTLFAQHVNSMTKFTKSEHLCYCLLVWTLPSFAFTWLQKMRRRVVLRIFDEIQAYATMHTDLFHTPHIVLHPRWSPDYTLVYIDVVYMNGLTGAEEEEVIVGFQSQQIYMLAGTGSYMFPYFLDPNDPLVKAISTLSADTVNMSAPLIKFVGELNVMLRVVDSAMMARTLTNVCMFLYEYKEQFELTGLLGGLTVKLAFVTPPDADSSTGDFKITDVTGDVTGNEGTVPITIHPTARLALIVLKSKKCLNPNTPREDSVRSESSDEAPPLKERLLSLRDRQLGSTHRRPPGALFGTSMPADAEESMQPTFSFKASKDTKAVDIRLKMARGKGCRNCCGCLRYVLLHNMHQPQCCKRTVKLPLFLGMFLLDLIQFGLALLYLSLVVCITNNSTTDDKYCPIPMTFFLFLMIWPPMVPLIDPVINMAVLCYNTPRIGRLHSVTSTLALLSPLFSAASCFYVRVDWLEPGNTPGTTQIIWSSWIYYALTPAVLFLLKVLQIYGTQLFIATAETRNTNEWNELLYITRHHVKREQFA